jgi:hypothetical protein
VAVRAAGLTPPEGRAWTGRPSFRPPGLAHGLVPHGAIRRPPDRKEILEFGGAQAGIELTHACSERRRGASCGANLARD